MSKEVKRYGAESCSRRLGVFVRAEDYDALLAERDAAERELLIAKSDIKVEQRVSANLREHKNEYMDAAEATRKALIAEIEALKTERDALRNDHGSMRNAMKNARYRIEQGRVWNGMGWTLTGLHAYQQQVALDEIDAALQGAKP